MAFFDVLEKTWPYLAAAGGALGGWFMTYMGWLNTRKDKALDRTNEEEDKLVALLKESLAQTREENEKLKERLDALQAEFHAMNTQLTSIKDLLAAATGANPESLSITRIRALFATRDNNIKPMVRVVQLMTSVSFVKRYVPPAFDGGDDDWDMLGFSRAYDTLYLRGARYEGRTDQAVWEKPIASNYRENDTRALECNGPIYVSEIADSHITGTRGRWVGTKETFQVDGDVFMIGRGVHIHTDGTIVGQLPTEFKEQEP